MMHDNEIIASAGVLMSLLTFILGIYAGRLVEVRRLRRKLDEDMGC